MFCENCGSKLAENAFFCSHCGAKVSDKLSGMNNNDNNDILLEVKPTFKFVYIALPRLFKELVFIIPFVILIILAVNSINTTIINSVVKQIINFMIVILIGIPIIRMLYVILRLAIDKRQYDKITYLFYNDKVVFRDDFLNTAEKELKYKHIKEIIKKQTFIQRIFNIGNVVMYSNAESGFSSGIALINIENVNDIYAKIREITNMYVE